MTEDKKKDIIQSMVTRNFSITKCPEIVFNKFVNFCKAETNDNYSMGLKLLLEAKEVNVKEVVLFEHYMEIKEELAELNHKVSQLETKKKGQTFGAN